MHSLTEQELVAHQRPLPSTLHRHPDAGLRLGALFLASEVSREKERKVLVSRLGLRAPVRADKALTVPYYRESVWLVSL
jgi:hypothetical protein